MFFTWYQMEIISILGLPSVGFPCAVALDLYVHPQSWSSILECSILIKTKLLSLYCLGQSSSQDPGPRSIFFVVANMVPHCSNILTWADCSPLTEYSKSCNLN